jgi:LCP family protein required for cell wall assembly
VEGKRPAGTTALLVVIAVVCVVLAASGIYYMHLNNSLRVKDEQLLQSLRTQAGDDPFYMLLLGVDKGTEREEDEEYGADVSNYRSDTIMLARVDPQNVKATIVSIHRDTLVELPNGDTGKINAVYSLGGPSAVVDCVSGLANVPISHYAEIDFDAFMGIVDVIGGVEVTLPVDVYDPEYTELDLKAGTHVLNGHDALMLCRCRHGYDAYGDGDRFRAANQRMVIASILRKVLSSDAHVMVAAISAMAESITSDLSLNDILALAAKMREFDTETDLMTGMTPTEPEVYNGIYYEIIQEDAWRQMMERVDAGLSPTEAGGDDQTAGIAGSTSVNGDAAVAGAAAGAGANAVGASTEGQQPQGARSVTIIGVDDGRADYVAEVLASDGFAVNCDLDPSYEYYDNIIVYEDPALVEEAYALADYLGDGFTVMENDGSFYVTTDFLIRLAG